MEYNHANIVVEKAEDIIYYEETITDGTVVFAVIIKVLLFDMKSLCLME